MSRPAILCLASYHKGDRFLCRCHEEGWHVILLTAEALLTEPWPREAIHEVFAMPSLADRRAVINAVSYLMRSRDVQRLAALDDFDVELAGFLREYLRLPGFGDSTARLFRDKLAMRDRARQLGVRIPEYVLILNHAAVGRFMDAVPGPWLLKPRSEASSIGIQKLHAAPEVWHAIERLGDDQSFHLPERMVPGDLYHVDSLVADGQVVFAQPSRYRRPLWDVYHGGGTYGSRTLPPDAPEVGPLRQINEQVLTGFGLDRGVSHSEFMRSHADGQFYFIETSARVGGASTAEMVEAATGLNLWSEWAKLELDRGKPYEPPPVKAKHAGGVISLARQEWPDTAGFTDPEIVYRLVKRYHVGFVVCADTPERV